MTRDNVPSEIRLADPTFTEPQDVYLLLGAEYLPQLLKLRKINQRHRQPLLQTKKLGWIVIRPAKADERLWEQYFLENIVRREDNRISVKLPFKDDQSKDDFQSKLLSILSMFRSYQYVFTFISYSTDQNTPRRPKKEDTGFITMCSEYVKIFDTLGLFGPVVKQRYECNSYISLSSTGTRY